MLSQEVLTSNIAALTKAQGKCPVLGALSSSMRVAVSGNAVQVQLRTPADGWQTLDSPAAAAESSWLRQGSAPDADQVVLVGAGLGYALAAQSGLKRVIAIEPHPGLATLFLSQRDWRPWIAAGRLRLLTGPDYVGATDVARLLDGLSDVSIVLHPLRHRWEPEVMTRATAVATRVVQNARANGRARKRFAGPYLLQTLTNLEAIGREADAAVLEGQFAGTPAVVVGAGPSLDENARDLAGLQDRAMIVAADTTLGPLLSHGVRPHFAVAVDSSALNARHLTAAPVAADVALAAEGSVHPSALERFAGRTFTFRVSEHEPWPWLRALGVGRASLRTWGSVLTSAFNLARHMGCDPIVFAGADLAFTGMRPYCRGTIYDAMWQEWMDKGCTWEALMADYFSRQPELYRDDVHGVPTRTAPHLVSFRDWLVEQTSAAGSGRFINATNAGILHGGRVVQSTLNHVLGGAPRTPDLRAAVRARYLASTRGRQDASRVAALLRQARSSPGKLPMERWLDFAVSTVTREQIVEALG